MFVFFILIILLTFNSIYDGNSFKTILINLKQIKPVYFLIGLSMIFVYFLLQGIYMKSILKALNKNITLRKGIFYSMIEFFFSGITPSSTGGQPVQLYYMRKDKIPLRKIYITLLLNTIFFKLIILILGILVLIFRSKYVFLSSGIYVFFFILGFMVDLFIVILGFLLLTKPKYIKKIITIFVNKTSNIKLISRYTKNIEINSLIKRYKDELTFINDNKKLVFYNFIITFIQRLLLFSVAYLIYRSLGFSKYGYFDLLMIQVSVQVAIEALLLPGGAGLSEGMYHNIFVVLFGSGFADTGMLLTRTFSFYIPLLISGLVIFFYSTLNRKRK
jgi:uncharacterized protein (TIRG00374 family)